MHTHKTLTELTVSQLTAKCCVSALFNAAKLVIIPLITKHFHKFMEYFFAAYIFLCHVNGNSYLCSN